MSKSFTITIASNQSLLAQVRGMAIRPAIKYTDRKKEARRKECRGNRRWEE